MDAGNRRKEDSGLIDLDALMRQANGAESAAVTRKEEAPKKVTLIAPPKNEPPKSEASPVSLESTPALVTPIPQAPRVPEKLVAPAATTPRAPSASRSFKRPLVAASVALALLGAGALHSRVRSTPIATTPAPVAVVTPHEPAVVAPRPLENAATSANDLPSASASASTSASTSAGIAPAKYAATSKTADAVITTTELIPESPAQGNDLGRAMHDAVGDGSSRVAKVEGTRINDARTLRPSPGAVIGALNVVLPAARECLGPDDAIRVGTVTFRSDGAVAKVELNGTRDSDGCIRSAVSRARVEPFADDTFTTRVTVRP